MRRLLARLCRSALKGMEAYLDWSDRRTETRRRAVLNDHHTLEFCLVGCVLLLIMAWMSGTLRVVGRSVCTLALIVAFLKLWQLALIAIVNPEGRQGE